ncbi:MAG: hypothetical protein ACR2HG_12505 [Pyrinomonadaceae bacterium]
MFQTKFSKILICLLLLILTFSVSAQKRKTGKRKTIVNSAPPKTETPTVEEANAAAADKKNVRPDASGEQTSNQMAKTNSRPVAAKDNPVYFYEFSQPAFDISKINIEHDENGKGVITFQKKDLNEPITDPLQLSPATLDRLKNARTALNFLDSNENYQTVKDYSNLGTMTFTMKKDGKSREAKFNWTENKNAKALADEYRKIGQQFIWVFDISVARENQPLDAPRLLDALDALIRRDEISDAAQMIPLLNELADDERIPLIARNHAAKLVKQIEKKQENKK